MDGQNVLDRFDFEDDRSLDDDIGTPGAIETNSFINQRQFDLPLNRMPALASSKLRHSS